MRDEASRTAEAVCLFRASDQRRRAEERILDDPYARAFLGPVARAALATWEATGRLGAFAEEYAPGLVAYVLARHRFIDDALAGALAAEGPGRIEQVVLLGAGYDTRAYRFASALADRPVFELDFPATSRRKAQLVAEKGDDWPRGQVRSLEIDFLTERVEDRLTAAGFTPGKRSFFVWEGVSMYLTRKAVQATLRTVRALSAPGSTLAMDFWFLLDTNDLRSSAHRVSASFLELLGERILLSLHPEDAPAFFAREGLEVADLADPAELERRYVRDGRRVYPACYVLSARTV